MLSTERRDFILKQLEQDGSIRVTELAGQLEVDPVTIRRDLDRLESEGFLRRVHGGAVPRNGLTEPSMGGIERRIAEAAAQVIPDNKVLFLGPGKLTLEMVPFLTKKNNLTIITNALDIGWAIATSQQQHMLHVLGGQAEENHGLYGDIRDFPQISADWVILEAKGFNAERGLTHDHVHYAQIARKLFSLGGQVMELLMPEQVGGTGAVFIAPAEEVDILVTGREAANAPLWDLSEIGVRIVLT